MKRIIAIALFFTSTTVFAHPGGHSLTCHSSARSGSKQIVDFKLSRMNGPGWVEPGYEITIDGKTYAYQGTSENFSYGDTFHNSPLGVINITATNAEENLPENNSFFRITGIPSTVQAFDSDGNKVVWDIKDDQDECYDTNGRAVFQGVIHGWLDDHGNSIEFDTQVLDCELTYDSGMAC
jgi:hypothetical protein